MLREHDRSKPMSDEPSPANVEVLRPGGPTNDTVELDRLRREIAALREQANHPRSLTELVLATDVAPEFFRRLATYLVLDKPAWDEFMSRCAVIASAQMYGHKKSETVAAAALKGMDMGMGFMESLDKIKVIHGTPTICGPKAKALIDQRLPGNRNECTESDDEKCIWIMRRPGREEKIFELTYEEVKHLADRNDLWNTYPRRMLKWNCFSEGAQEIYGDVLGDMYLTEELDGAPLPSTETKSAPKRNRKSSKKSPSKTSKNGLSDEQREALQKSLHEATLHMDTEWPHGITKRQQTRFTKTRTLLFEGACQGALEFVPDHIEPDQAKLVRAVLDGRSAKWRTVLSAVYALAELAQPDGVEKARRDIWTEAWKAEAGSKPTPKALAAADAALADKMLAGLKQSHERLKAQKKDGEGD